MGALQLQPFKGLVTHLGYPPYFMTTRPLRRPNYAG
jgi:hypothetical protein